MRALAAITYGTLTLLAALGLAAIGRREPRPVLLPVVRTTALIVCVAAVAAALLRL
ncbi:hypothetical protein [Streptomyces sp. NPDC052496]|uniref:hypothetical protein n=1 Tax=Streptomyces sp. NPDC052496 TaxID=3154951 RepID=UPI0034386817